MTIDESLRRIEHGAALLRYTVDLATVNAEQLQPDALSGLGYALDEIAGLARLARAAIAGSADIELETNPEETTATTQAARARARPSRRRRSR